MAENVWYYTNGHELDQLFPAGGIAPVPHVEVKRSVVWLSTDELWDMTKSTELKTKTGLMRLTMEQTEKVRSGLFRFKAPNDPTYLKWDDVDISQATSDLAKNIRNRGGNPKRWRFSETPIQISDCLAFERWNPATSAWQAEPYHGNTFIEMGEEMLEAAKRLQLFHTAVPILTLIYSLIDTLGWLAIPDVVSDTNGDKFMEWVDRFMISSHRFPKCSSVDLYGARCGILHTRSPVSKKSRSGKAMTLLYAFGELTVDDLQREIDLMNRTSETLPVHVDDLIESTRDGMSESAAYLESNRDQAIIVRQKTGVMLPTGKGSERYQVRRKDLLKVIGQAMAIG